MSEERLIIESLFRIPDKDSREDVDFILNPEQAQLDSELCGRDIIPKARQLGITTFMLARHLARCLYMRNRNCVIISHEGKATQRLLRHVHYMIKHIKGPEPEIQYASKNEITFPKTDSSIYIGTAGSDNFGHGDTITDLHGSEVARWPNPAQLLKGVFQAVPPSGCITLESTGNGQGNYYHRACIRAAAGIGYKLHFFNWLNRPEYRLNLSEDERRRFLSDLRPELEEPELYERGLTVEQLAWRRKKIVEDLDYDLQDFKEQYPISLEECFQASGASYFKRVKYVPTELWKEESRTLSVLHPHPIRDYHYAIGADPAAGLGGDRDGSAGEVYCLETGEQVAELWSNRLEPHEFASRLDELGRRFNRALLNVERNNHGILTIKTLIDLKYPNLHQGKWGQQPTKEFGKIQEYGTYIGNETKRMQVLGTLREVLSTHELIIHSVLLKGELDSFCEQENGRIEANEGCHDDRVLASAHAAFIMPIAAQYMPPEKPKHEGVYDAGDVDGIITECENKFAMMGGELPIPTFLEDQL